MPHSNHYSEKETKEGDMMSRSQCKNSKLVYSSNQVKPGKIIGEKVKILPGTPSLCKQANDDDGKKTRNR